MQNYVYVVSQNSGSTYTWSITNGVIVSGQGTNVVTVMWSQASNGTLSVVESNGYCEDSTGVAISTTFSIAEGPIKNYLVYPNPSTGLFVFESFDVAEYEIQIFDLNGRMISVESEVDDKIMLDLSNYPAGVYQLVVKDGINVFTERLVLIH